MIRRYKPEYVLLESLDNINPDSAYIARLESIFKIPTLYDFSTSAYINLSDIGITESVIMRIKDEIKEKVGQIMDKFMQSPLMKQSNERGMYDMQKTVEKSVKKDGFVPQTYAELISHPLYDFHPLVLNILYTSMKREGHASDRIQELRGYVLDHSKCTNRKIGNIVYAAVQSGSKLAGCDISKKSMHQLMKEMISETDEKREEIGIEDEYSGIGMLIRLGEKLKDYEKEIIIDREDTMGERIAEFAKKRKTNKPVIAIIGSHHLRTDSGIYPILHRYGIKYRTMRMGSRHKNPEDAIEYLFG